MKHDHTPFLPGDSEPPASPNDAPRSGSVAREEPQGCEPCSALEAAANFTRLLGVPNPVQALGTAAEDVAPPAETITTRLGEAGQHPSIETLEAIAACRDRHIRRGHTPESDAERGPLYFIDASREYMRRALKNKTAKTRRKNQIIAIAILVAMLDAEDFKARETHETEE